MCRCHLPFAALAVLLFVGCGDSNDPNGGGPSAFSDIGEMGRDEVESALDALTLPTTLAPFRVGGGASCATASSTSDTDGDAAPNDATYTFTAPPCRFTGIRGSTLDLVGQLRVQDPSETAGFGYAATITGLRLTLTADDEDDPDYTAIRNGFRTLTGTTTGLQLATDLQVVRTFAAQSDGSIDEQWTVTFTPETPLQINQPISSGELAIEGTLGWTRGAESFNLEVTTPTPVHYDAGCASVQRFDDGELRLTGDFAGTAGYVRVRWSECGREPEIDFIGETE